MVFVKNVLSKTVRIVKKIQNNVQHVLMDIFLQIINAKNVLKSILNFLTIISCKTCDGENNNCTGCPNS